MNIKNNILNYLDDKDYVITIYDNNLYIYKYDELLNLYDHLIIVKINKKIVKIHGINLKMKKMTEEEFIISGNINNIEIGETNEKD